ncbi:hypothetical protein HOD83_03535 [Candidatus Woesearchaeota archaeon]|nr:hypothetical protein [Candidatus Woesearchaeota archaeon]MBT4114338.1 hypothetical protein [Candidatus Woesearchaeota archaeon]MBT4248627.1 hypothetical protein [Candidatus Woesearchaeota archaeon]
MAKKTNARQCHCGHAQTPAVIVLILAILWTFAEAGWISLDIPWLPLILIIFSVAMIRHHH